MDNDLQKAAERFLSSEEGRRINGKREEIQRAAASADGARVKAMLDKGGFQEAVRRGDAKALQEALAGVMRTDSGKALVRQLQEIMGKK